MKTHILLIVSYLSASGIAAQAINVTPGKKLAVQVESQSAMTISAMGQDMNMESKNTINSDYEITAVTDKGYAMHNTIRRIQNNSKMMGMETVFDTNDETNRNDPKLAGIVNLVGKPVDISIEDKKVTVTNGELMLNPVLSQMGIRTNQADELGKFVLYKSDLTLSKPGYEWKDSVQTEALKMVNRSMVSSVSETEIEISVLSDISVHTVVQQMGMSGKISGKGTIKSKRWYNRSTGILLKEEGNGDFSAETEIMDQRVPMDIKSKTVIIVQ